MKITLSNVLCTLVTISVALAPLVAAVKLNVSSITLNASADGAHIDIKMKEGNNTVNVKTVDLTFLSKLQTVGTTVAPTKPPKVLGVTEYEINLLNGFTSVIKQEADDRIIIVTNYNETTFTKTKLYTSTTTDPKFEGATLIIGFPPLKTGGAEQPIVISSIPADLEKLKLYQGVVSVPTWLADGSYTYKGTSKDHIFYFTVADKVCKMLMINQKSNSLWKETAKLAFRPAMFTIFFVTTSGFMVLVLSKFDSELYALGGGFRGALGMHENAEDLADDFASSGNGDTDLSGDLTAPDQNRLRGDRSSSASSEVTSGGTDLANDGDDSSAQDPNEIDQKTDARSASLLALSVTVLAALFI